jgi:hypothetical protein
MSMYKTETSVRTQMRDLLRVVAFFRKKIILKLQNFSKILMLEVVGT